MVKIVYCFLWTFSLLLHKIQIWKLHYKKNSNNQGTLNYLLKICCLLENISNNIQIANQNVFCLHSHEGQYLISSLSNVNKSLNISPLSKPIFSSYFYILLYFNSLITFIAYHWHKNTEGYRFQLSIILRKPMLGWLLPCQFLHQPEIPMN